MMELVEKIGVPLVAWSAVILVVFLGEIARLLFRGTAALKDIKGLTRSVELLPAMEREGRRAGLSLGAVESLRTRMGAAPGEGARHWAHAVDESIEPYEDAEGKRGWFSMHPIEEILPSTDVIGRQFHASSFDAVPGILTSLGLFGTFVAILLALWELRVNSTTNMIEGIDTLIEGLSGKFVSSVVALLTAVFFVAVQRNVQGRLHRAYQGLLAALTSRVPYLSPSRILLDIQKASRDQSVSLANISSDVVDRFVGAFKTDFAPAFSATLSADLQAELRPTLQALGGTLEGLRESVGSLEASKQESVVGEIRQLTEAMQRSMEESLRHIGRQFSESLSGSAQGEFAAVTAALGNSATLLQSMNEQFTTLQAALASVVQEARGSTRDQLEANREQALAMTRLMEGLMERLNDAANQNLQSVSASLTAVVGDLSSRVQTLSEDLVRTVGETTASSQQSANEVVAAGERWSRQTSDKLEELLQSIAARGQDLERAGGTMQSAQQTLRSTLEQSGQALTALGRAAEQVKTYTEALAGAGRRAEDLQKGQAQIATLASEGVQQLRSAAAEHQAFLKDYRSVYEQYRTAFETLDKRIGDILKTISDGMGDYNTAVEKNFRSIVQVANEYVPQLAETFNVQVQALGEQLDELGDVLERNTARMK